MLLVAFGAAACASMAPRTVEVSKTRMQELIARRFPVKRRLLEAIDITVDSPRLTLQPESNRIAVDLLLN
ncbi:MAG: DUF1439 domain-containing protein, partial [Pseudomonadota bacterium]|nr:DUF1439 domain-containing protein [Pseudomonadota bacterium]